MEPMRPSILRRPLRETKVTEETADAQWRREQERIATKAMQQYAHETRLMNTLYPTREVQQQRHQELEQIRQEQLAAKAAARQREEEVQAAFIRPATAPVAMQPWAAPSLAYGSAAQQVRKQFEAQLAEENRKMAMERALQRQQERQAELQEARSMLLEGSPSFWNIGAAAPVSRSITQELWGYASDQPKPLLGNSFFYRTSVSPTAATGARDSSSRSSGLQPPWALFPAQPAGSLANGSSSYSSAYGSTSSSSYGGGGSSSSLKVNITPGSYPMGTSSNSNSNSSIIAAQEEGSAVGQQRPGTAPATTKAGPPRMKHPWEWHE